MEDKSTWSTGAGLLIGLGAGFFFLQQSAFIFVGCTLLGLGLGLLLASLMGK